MFFGGAAPDKESKEEEVQHEENEWGIEVVQEQDMKDEGSSEPTPDASLPTGIEYSAPVRFCFSLLVFSRVGDFVQVESESKGAEEVKEEVPEESVEDLMDQLKSLNDAQG